MEIILILIIALGVVIPGFRAKNPAGTAMTMVGIAAMVGLTAEMLARRHQQQITPQHEQEQEQGHRTWR